MYIPLTKEVDMLEEKIARLNSEITSPKNQIMSDMPKGGESPEMTDKIIRLIELKNKCNRHWDKIIDLRTEIEEAVVGLDDPMERTILSYRYLMGMNWVEICYEVNYEWAQVHRIHSRALKSMIRNDTRKSTIV